MYQTIEQVMLNFLYKGTLTDLEMTKGMMKSLYEDEDMFSYKEEKKYYDKLCEKLDKIKWLMKFEKQVCTNLPAKIEIKQGQYNETLISKEIK